MEITREIFWNIGNVRILIYLLGLVPIIVLAFGLWRRIKLWRIGKKDNRYDRIWERIKSTISYGIVQVRTLEKTYPGLMHLLIFWGFVILFLGTLIKNPTKAEAYRRAMIKIARILSMAYPNDEEFEEIFSVKK